MHFRNSPCARRSLQTLAILSIATTLLTACGGGGDDTGGGDATINFPIDSAVSAYATSAHSFSLLGALEGVSYTLNYGYVPGPSGTFGGRPTATGTLTLNLFANGVLAAQTVDTNFFTTGPYVNYGSVDRLGGGVSVFTQVANLPATAQLGQSGSLGTEVDYSDATLRTVVGSSTTSWSLEADTPGTALFCLHIRSEGALVGSECYRVNSSGAVLGVVVKAIIGTKVLTLS